MGELKEHLKEQYKTGYDIGADKSLTVAEAASQVLGAAKAEYSVAHEYAEARKQRKKAVAERLSELRKSRGYSQQEISKQTGINVVTLSGYEVGRNEPNEEALVRLADFYNVTTDYILCRTDNEQQA